MAKNYSLVRKGRKLTFECDDVHIVAEVDNYIQRIIDAENYRTLSERLLARVTPLGERSEEFDRENL